MDKLLLTRRFSNGGFDAEPDGIEGGQENERQDRPNRSPAYKCVGERSPEDREGQRNEREYRSQRCEDNRP